LKRKWQGGAHILDAGCGSGQHAYWLARNYLQSTIIALDCDQKAVAGFSDFIARVGLGNITPGIGLLEELSETAEYDIILNGSVMYCIPDDSLAMANLARALRQGGDLIVYSHTEPTYLHWRKAKERQRNIVETSPRSFSRDYSVPGLIELIENTGLIVDSLEITYGWFGSLAYELFHAFKQLRGFRYWFPLYFLFIHPFVLLLMAIDFWTKKERGNGVLIVAHKKTRGSP
jgi:SAM-dependent methyltransferase